MKKYFCAVALTMGIFALSGCQQVNTLRQWWQAYRGPASVAAPPASDLEKVSINLDAVARQYPAWKLAQQSPSFRAKPLSLSWRKTAVKSTFDGKTSVLPAPVDSGDKSTFSVSLESRPPAVVAASAPDLQEGKSWQEWQQEMSSALARSRIAVASAMRMDIADRMQLSQKDIPAAPPPLMPPSQVQQKMVNLRLKLLSNVALTPQQRKEAQQKLEALEEKWGRQLQSQTATIARKQYYARRIVPRQIRQAGQKQIEKRLHQLQREDAQSVAWVVRRQDGLLRQAKQDKAPLQVTLPEVSSPQDSSSLIFTAPKTTSIISSKAKKTVRLSAPASKSMRFSGTNQSGRLRQIAMQAARRAANQSALRHHWSWVDSSSESASQRKDVTSVVIKEANFP